MTHENIMIERYANKPVRLFDLQDAYRNGRVDERIELYNDFQNHDEGAKQTRFKSARERIMQKNAIEELRGNGYFAPIPCDDPQHVTRGVSRKDIWDTLLFLGIMLGLFIGWSLI